MGRLGPEADFRVARQAFPLQIAKKGLEGDGAAARAAMKAIEEARATRLAGAGPDLTVVIMRGLGSGSVNSALEPLRMARKLDRYRETAWMALEPWLVEAALDRLGDRRLTLEEQREIVQATRTPRKVRWPDWWQVMP